MKDLNLESTGGKKNWTKENKNRNLRYDGKKFNSNNVEKNHSKFLYSVFWTISVNIAYLWIISNTYF